MLGNPQEGTVTFVLTDLEGSTRLWEEHPAAMSAAMVRHDALVRQVVAHHGGTVVRARSEGDSAFAAFTSAQDAVWAALALQRVFAEEPWPDGIALPIRIGVLTGTAEYREGDYVGTSINRCARIRDLGRGGHVLLAETTTELIRNALPAGASLRDLGEVRLRGLTRPHRVFQLLHPDVASERPAISTSEPAHNLPARLTSFIGRADERDRLRDQLLTGPRLITLTGPGGAGKTRLGLEVADGLLDAFPDGVWLVELAGLPDAGLVPNAVASVLRLPDPKGGSAIDAVADHLMHRRALLVLDNCEHLVEACAEFAGTILERSPQSRILATSREPLGVTGEARRYVQSLAVPEEGQSDPTVIARSESVALFSDRAELARHGFRPDATNAAALGTICRHLDGIPLAIELAAARVATMTPDEIAARLEDRFWLLTQGPRTAPSRHKTLRMAIDWGHELLAETERVLLRRLAVFAGHFTREQVRDICGHPPLQPEEVNDVLAALVNKSFVVTEAVNGETRYRMLETIRVFARGQLDVAGEGHAFRDRHLRWFADLAVQALGDLGGPMSKISLDRLEDEQDDIREALGWVLAGGRSDEGLRLAVAMGAFWNARGYPTEGRRWLEALHARASDAAPFLRASALRALGSFARDQGDMGAATQYLDEAIALSKGIGDEHGFAEAMDALGSVEFLAGELENARAKYEESMSIHRRLGNEGAVAVELAHLGNIARVRGVLGDAHDLYAKGLEIWRALGNELRVAQSLLELGAVAATRRDLPAAQACFEEGLAIARTQGSKLLIAPLLDGLGFVAKEARDLETARAYFEEAMGIYRDRGERHGVAACLFYLGDCAALEGATTEARTFLEEALAMSRALNAPPLVAECLSVLGQVGLQEQDIGAARVRYGDALELASGLGNRNLVVFCIRGFASIAAATGRMEEAAMLIGGAEREHRDGVAIPVSAREAYEHVVAVARHALHADEFQGAFAKGEAASLDDLVALVLDARGL